MNYHPLPDGPAALGQTSREYWADRYADQIACSTVRNADLSIGPLRSRARASLYREYFRRAHAEFLLKTSHEKPRTPGKGGKGRQRTLRESG